MTFDIILSPNLKLSGRLGNPCTSQIVSLSNKNLNAYRKLVFPTSFIPKRTFLFVRLIAIYSKFLKFFIVTASNFIIFHLESSSEFTNGALFLGGPGKNRNIIIANAFIPKAIALIINVFLHLSHSINLLVLVLESASLTLQKYW